MDTPELLILDFNPRVDHGRNLRGILEDFPKFSSRVHLEDMTGQPAPLDEHLKQVFTGRSPGVVFIVLPQDFLATSRTIVKSLLGHGEDMVMVAVCCGNEPGEIYSLMQAGVTDFIVPPLNMTDIIPRTLRLIGSHRSGRPAVNAMKEKFGLNLLIGDHPVFLTEVQKIPTIAKCDTNVLLTGETGTGKELFARSIHYISARSKMPFIPVNCGAIPDELFEREFFGNVRGAYTGASSSEPGVISEANGGTLFLDEIDALPMHIQPKLLRFLQEKEYRRLGSPRIYSADVRVIAATNVSLEEKVRQGTFRRDLFYRLNVIPMNIPPLRERKDDVRPLAHHFIAKYAALHNKESDDISLQALDRLMAHDWPGNIRELENIIERAVVFSPEKTIGSESVFLPEAVQAQAFEPFRKAKEKAVRRFEVEYIKMVLARTRGNITRAALEAEKDTRVLRSLIRKHNIDVQHFKTISS